MSFLDSIIVSGVIMFGLTFICIVWSYAKGLGESPKELWIILGARMVEAVTYTCIFFTLALWLSHDCGLGDVEAGVFIGAMSIGMAFVTFIAGPLVDTFGIKKTFIFSFILLVISRIFMFWITDFFIIIILVLIPLIFGLALAEPASSVGIKKYTTTLGASLGFGLFYISQNIGTAVAGWVFDKFRDVFGEYAGATLPIIGHLSTYQLILLFSLGLTLISITIAFFMRDGVEMGLNGVIVSPPKKQTGNFSEIVYTTLKKGVSDVTGSLASVAKESFFWKFMLILTIVVFVRVVFFHAIYTFPKYGIRVIGEGAKIGTIFGVLNPVLIVFLVPLVAVLTKKISSYRMMIIGTTISSLSVFVAAIPGSFFSPLTNTIIGEFVFVRWLNLSQNMTTLMASPPSDFYWPLIFFLLPFTLGESLWSPRLLQFTAEIAPKGKEGTYIALSVLPWFLSKLFVGPMSGILLKIYTPLNEVVDAAGKTVQIVGDLSYHYMIWVWVGGTAILTPIGLVVFRHVFYSMEKEHSKMVE